MNSWMKKEDYESKYEYGYCWIAIESGYTNLKEGVCLAYYSEVKYFESPYQDAAYDRGLINAVMPIEKPEYPKEVG